MLNQYKVAIIGAGAAGIGMSAALSQYGIDDQIVLERSEIGNSFKNWNSQTRFISPSFTTNGFGVPDLNAVTPQSSPAYTLQNEHPSGVDYQRYLKAVVDHFSLPVREHAGVLDVTKLADYHYLLTLEDQTQITAKYIIVALGDYSFPDTANIQGADLGIHYRSIKDYEPFIGRGRQTIIGGNESAFDLAIHLAMFGIPSTLYTKAPAFNLGEPDPSKRLSTYTYNNYQPFAGKITVKNDYGLEKIGEEGNQYQLYFENGEQINVDNPPLLATGFSNTQSPIVRNLFETSHGLAVLNEDDESTIAGNAFMVGPEVVHGNVILCYVYKYRQRFAPLTELIVRRENQQLKTDVAERYRINNMFLKNFANCSVDCDC